MSDTAILEKPSVEALKRKGPKEDAKKAPQPITITLDRKELLKALGAVLQAHERQNVIPVLSGLLFECETGCLRVTATNMDQWLTASIVADAERPTRFVLLEPRGLESLCKLLDRDAVTLTFTPHEGGLRTAVTLTAGATEAEFNTLPWEDFPIWQRKTTAPIALNFGGAELIRAIDRVSYAISTEETRYYLNGIYLHSRPNYDETTMEPWMAATNGHILALTRVEAELAIDSDAATQDSPYAVIIPRGSVPMLRAMAARGAVELLVWDTAIAVETDDFTFYSKLIDGTYPDINKVIPSEHPPAEGPLSKEQRGHAILSPAMIVPAIRRTATLCRSKSLALRLTIDGEAIELQMRDLEGGTVTETVKLPEPATRRFEHGVNGKYLAQVLGSFDGPARYRYADPASPLVLYSADAPSQASAAHLAVLMPMRV